MNSLNGKNSISGKRKSGFRWQELLLFVAGCLLLASCNTSKYLDTEKGEIFLTGNEIKFDKPAAGKLKNKAALSFELAKLYTQKPNRKFFGVPRQYFYYVAQDTLSRSKFSKTIGKVANSTLGEEPSLLDSTLARQTAIHMKNYLQNRGYFFASVEEQITANRKETKATVTYHVAPDGLFTIDSVMFVSKDTAIKRILDGISGETFLKKGQPIDIKLYEQEVARVTKHLRNNGYAQFYPQYITNLEGIDSSNVTKSAKLKFEVLTPTGKEKHQSYTVGNIYIYPDYDPISGRLMEPDTLLDGIYFANGGNPFRVKPRTLSNSVYFRPGNLYAQEEVDATVRQLSSLGVFRPPTIRFEEDSLQTGVLNFTILLTPNKKWELGADFDINSVERSGAVGNRNLIGLSFSPSLRNRNFLRGAELLVGTVDMGIELAPFGPDSSIVNTLDFRLQGDLYFPRFADYFSLWKGLKNLHLVKESFYQKLKRRATSRFSSSYNLLILLNNYSLQFVNLSYGFDVPVSNNSRLIINHFGVDLLIPKIVQGSRFDTLLQLQPFIQNSFSKQFITGFLFRDLTYVYSSPPSLNGSYWFFRGYFDLSGLEVMTANIVYNAISNRSPDFEFFNVDFSHYSKLELDGRRYWQFGPNRMLVARLNAGVALPYYQSTTVPYVKQFFAGGPYSIRGWYARALGPGLYKDPLTEDETQRNLYYQSGDVKIEMNLEYRFHLMKPFGLFNLYGAWFLDAGNVWTVKKDENRPGAELAWSRITDETGTIIRDNFLREMAVSAGFGTRWDFTYFVFRLDLGTPLRNHYPDKERSQSYLVDLSKWRFSEMVFNISLGYPF